MLQSPRKPQQKEKSTWILRDKAISAAMPQGNIGRKRGFYMIASLKKWFGLVLRQVGLDAKALRTMNQGLKWTGVALIAGVAIAAALSFFSESSPKLSSNSPASTAVSEKSDASAQRKITSVVTAKAVFGWVTLLSIALVGFIEPSEPKRDGRFKTGFKNNATVRKKTVGEIQTQRLALAVAAASAAFWYFL